MPCPGWWRTLAATYGLRKASLHGGLGAAHLAMGHRQPGLEQPSNAAKPRGLARCGAHGGPCASQESWGRHSPETLAFPGGFECRVAFPRPRRTCWKACAGVSAGVYTRTRVPTCCVQIDWCNHAHRQRSCPGACGCQRAACQLSPFSVTPPRPTCWRITQITAGETCEIVKCYSTDTSVVWLGANRPNSV